MFGLQTKQDGQKIECALNSLREEIKQSLASVYDNLSVVKEQIADVERFWRVNDIDMSHKESMKKLMDSWVDSSGNTRKRKKYIRTI